MSQVVSHNATLRGQARHHWVVALSALLALIATTAVVLVLAIDGGSADPVVLKSQPALRTDGGPSESAVAAAVGSRAGSDDSGRPDESRIAATIGGH
jgi:hypothetical protein